MTSGSFVRTVREDEVAEGAPRVVDIEGKPVLLCRTAGHLHAVSNICSHAEEKLECGRIRGGWIACPLHGARFDLATGRAMNPPATRPIPVYEWRITDGWIEVAV
jgi:3-phenylpropionate/trans-cinnamate dioxygenase ferredoxin subunit